MCKCLTENVVCCCFNCALSMLLSIISTFFVVFVIIGIVIYFIYFHEDEKSNDIQKNLQDNISTGFDKITKALSN